MEHVIGFTTMILAMAIAIIALPAQILKNHREKRVGISWWVIVLAFGVYASRALYGFVIGSYYIMLPDFLGTFFSAILAFQALVRPRLTLIQYLEERKWL